jgi:hypothetical protein
MIWLWYWVEKWVVSQLRTACMQVQMNTWCKLLHTLFRVMGLDFPAQSHGRDLARELSNRPPTPFSKPFIRHFRLYSTPRCTGIYTTYTYSTPTRWSSIALYPTLQPSTRSIGGIKSEILLFWIWGGLASRQKVDLSTKRVSSISQLDNHSSKQLGRINSKEVVYGVSTSTIQ